MTTKLAFGELLNSPVSDFQHSLFSATGNVIPVKQVRPAKLLSNPRLEKPALLVLLQESIENELFTVIETCKKTLPETAVLIFTTDYSGANTRRLFKAGATDVFEFQLNAPQIAACLQQYLPDQTQAPVYLVTDQTPTRISRTDQQPSPNSSADKRRHTTGANPNVAISLLGNFSIQINNKAIELTNQAKLVFSCLACNFPETMHRDKLAAALWPEKFKNAPDSARKSLNVELTRIRQAFRQQAGYTIDFLRYDKQRYWLEFGGEFCSNLQQFNILIQEVQTQNLSANPVSCETLRQAIEAYPGQLLRDFPADSGNWLHAARQKYSAAFEQIAEQYTELQLQSTEPRTLAALCTALLERDDRMEIIHRRLMICYAAMGMYNKVAEQYQRCCDMLEREFNSQPSPETTRVWLEIKGLKN